MEFIANGGSYINGLIKQEKSKNRSEIRISGNFEIEQTILVPSDTTLILDNCHLKMADNTFCQMFRNENADKKNVTDRNIHIRGEGSTVLDGGNYNGLSEKNCEKDGRPFIIVNNILTFADVDSLSVSDVEIRNMRWWALNFIACSNGHLHDISFASDATVIDPDTGERLYGLGTRTYGDIYIKNSDGIDLRLGCHHFLIENITGFTEDDTVALTALNGKTENYYPFPASAGSDIHNVVIRNVRASALCGIIRLLNQGGTKLYNVTIDGVYDTSAEDDRLDRGHRGVLVGDTSKYGKYYPTEDDTFNINISNVESRAATALRICGAVKNLKIENIRGFDGCEKTVEYINQ